MLKWRRRGDSSCRTLTTLKFRWPCPRTGSPTIRTCSWWTRTGRCPVWWKFWTISSTTFRTSVSTLGYNYTSSLSWRTWETRQKYDVSCTCLSSSGIWHRSWSGWRNAWRFQTSPDFCPIWQVWLSVHKVVIISRHRHSQFIMNTGCFFA